MKKSFCFIALFISFSLYAQQSDIYLQAALKAERWIHSQEINKKDSGLAWYNTRGSTFYTSDAYHGNSGVVLFYLELYNTTKRREYLNKAEKGLKYILLRHEPELRTWTGGDGLANVIYTAHQVYLQSENIVYKKAAIDYLNQLNQQIVQIDSVKKYLQVTGYATIGSIFLYADKYKLTNDALLVAKQIGNILLAGSVKAKLGIRWPWFNGDTTQKRFIPSFSHGTAGVASYLVNLYDKTKDSIYLEAAVDGAEYLLSLSNDSGWVPTWDPPTMGPSTPVRYYLGVCGGPAGTSRLFYQLFNITGEKKWVNIIKLSANSIIQSGIPEKRTLGFWNNVSQCCGSAGIAEWYLSLNEHYEDSKYVEFSKHMLNDILKRATVENDMMSWVQAENNNQPDLLQAQTGYGQGAAGIGIALLHMYNFENKKKGLIKLPDNPF